MTPDRPNRLKELARELSLALPPSFFCHVQHFEDYIDIGFERAVARENPATGLWDVRLKDKGFFEFEGLTWQGVKRLLICRFSRTYLNKLERIFN